MFFWKRIEYAEFHATVLQKFLQEKSTIFGLQFYVMEWINKVNLVGMEGAIITKTSLNRLKCYGF